MASLVEKTRLALAGVPIAKAMRFVNHADEEIHRIYTRIRGEDVEGCSEAIAIRLLLARRATWRRVSALALVPPLCPE